jgi:putative flippase GtrA
VIGLVIRAFRSRILRFVIIGGAGSALWYVVYAALVFAGLHYALANLVAVAVAVLFSFRTQGRFVFDNPDGKLIGRFLLSRLVLYFTSVLLINRLMWTGFDAYVSGAVATPVMAILSYVVQRFFVFRMPPAPM